MRKLRGKKVAISRVEKCTPSELDGAGRLVAGVAKSPSSHAKITVVPSE